MLSKIADTQRRRIAAGRKIRSDDKNPLQLLEPNFPSTILFTAVLSEHTRRRRPSR
jgi:hypothetical protein